jgi:hypothetical protein
MPGSAAVSASRANRTRKGTCGVCGQSAYVTYSMLGTSLNSGMSVPQRTRSRINQQGSQANPWPASVTLFGRFLTPVFYVGLRQPSGRNLIQHDEASLSHR